MAADLTMPKLGPEMESALLVEWLVEDGAEVEAGQPLATVETDKITSDVESPGAGRITILAAIDTEIAVGARLATIGTVGDREPEPAAAPDNADAEPATVAAALSAGGTPAGEEPRARASPLARRIAAERGIDLSTLPEAGHGTPIRKRHVEAAGAAPISSNGASGSASRLTDGPGEKLSPMRRRIAERLTASLRETAQITDFREHDVTELVAMRREGARWAKVLGLGLTFTDLFVRAAALSLAEVPALNASLTADGRLVEHEKINIGIAVAVPAGLIVPVLHDAEGLGLGEIHERVADLVSRARENRLELAELADGTFTISNIGSYGSHLATPILVQGQVGILGTGAFLERPVVRDGEVAVGTVMYTSLTIDHRIVDGETAGRFQTAIGELLADPSRLL